MFIVILEELPCKAKKKKCVEMTFGVGPNGKESFSL